MLLIYRDRCAHLITFMEFSCVLLGFIVLCYTMTFCIMVVYYIQLLYIGIVRTSAPDYDMFVSDNEYNDEYSDMDDYKDDIISSYSEYNRALVPQVDYIHVTNSYISSNFYAYIYYIWSTELSIIIKQNKYHHLTSYHHNPTNTPKQRLGDVVMMGNKIQHTSLLHDIMQDNLYQHYSTQSNRAHNTTNGTSLEAVPHTSQALSTWIPPPSTNTNTKKKHSSVYHNNANCGPGLGSYYRPAQGTSVYHTSVVQTFTAYNF